MHVGNIYGICPTHYFNEHTNAFQRWVIEQWRSLISNHKYPDILILGGDIIDGSAHKDATVLCIPDVQEQVDAAVDLLTPLVGPNTEIRGVTGSGYHRGKGSGFDGDQQVTEKLIETTGAKGNHNRKYQGLYLHKLFGCPNIFVEHKGKNAKTELNVMMKRAYKTSAPRIDVLISAHLHRKWKEEDEHIIIHTPCWQWETDFMLFTEPVDIGATLLYVDLESKKISSEFWCPKRPTELYEAMDNWEGLDSERVKELQKLDDDKKKAENEKLYQLFKSIDPKTKMTKEKFETKLGEARAMQLPSNTSPRIKEERKPVKIPTLPKKF